MTELRGSKNATSLPQLSPDSLLDNIRYRYDTAFDAETADTIGGCGIYTWVGNVLVAVNPYRSLGVYDDSHIDHHFRKTIAHADPHPFGIAAHAYCCMQKSRSAQSIIISGESGAGKTETSKYVLQFLTRIAADESVGYEAGLISHTSPILEAFGNAKTCRNDNSSRFGKSIKLFFDSDSCRKVVGAKIETFLLARSRVTHTPVGERNYHIFYLLLNGLAREHPLRSELFFQGLDSSDFKYLGASTKSLYMSDKEFMQILLDSFEAVGFSTTMRDTLFRQVAAVAWLGNIEVSACPANPAGACYIPASSDRAVGCVASLLGIGETILRDWLTKQKITAGKSEIVWTDVPHQKARMFRDALAKRIYSRVFDCLVDEINIALASKLCQSPKHRFPSFSDLDAMTPPGGFGKQSNVRKKPVESLAAVSISILDLFGFENMANNGLEQLCINFANEKMHTFFLENVVHAEMEEYDREGIPYTPVTPVDNKDVVDLIHLGVIESLRRSTMDCMLRPLDSVDYDMDFCDKLANIPKSTQTLSVTKASKRNSPSFYVNHFAGGVNYTAEGFVESNKDFDHKVESLLSLSQSSFFNISNSQELLDDEEPVPPSPSSSGSGMFVKRCIASSFALHVECLVQELKLTRGHYIKCIKPNEYKRANCFDAVRVNEQLKVGGLFEVLLLMGSAFPTRIPFVDVLSRYKHLLQPQLMRILTLTGSASAKIFTEETLCMLDTDLATIFGVSRAVLRADDDFSLGTSKLFVKLGKLEPLEELLYICDENEAVAKSVAEVIGSRILRRRRLRQIAFIKQVARFSIILRRRRSFRKWFRAYFIRLAFLVKIIREKYLPVIFQRRETRRAAILRIEGWLLTRREQRFKAAILLVLQSTKSFMARFSLKYTLPAAWKAHLGKVESQIAKEILAREHEENKGMLLNEQTTRAFWAVVRAKEITYQSTEAMKELAIKDDEIRQLSVEVTVMLNKKEEYNGLMHRYRENWMMSREDALLWRSAAINIRKEKDELSFIIEESRIEKRKRELDQAEALDTMCRRYELQINEERASFTSELQIGLLDKARMIETSERVSLDRDRLSRENKKLRSSIFIQDQSAMKINQENRESQIAAAIEEARLDFVGGAVEVQAERKKQDFESKVGTRKGSVKYCDWLKAQNIAASK